MKVKGTRKTESIFLTLEPNKASFHYNSWTEHILNIPEDGII